MALSCTSAAGIDQLGLLHVLRKIKKPPKQRELLYYQVAMFATIVAGAPILGCVGDKVNVYIELPT